MLLKKIFVYGQSILCSYLAIMGALTRSNTMLCTSLFIMLVALPGTLLYIIAKAEEED